MIRLLMMMVMCSFVGLEQVDASRQLLDDRIERLSIEADYPLIHPYHSNGFGYEVVFRVGNRTPLFNAMLEYARKWGVLQQGDAVPQCAYLVVPAPFTLQPSAGGSCVECRPQHLFKSLYQGYKDRVKHIGGTVWAMAPTTISYSIIEGRQVSPVKVIASGSDKGDVSWHTSRDGSNEDCISPDSLRLQDQYGNFIGYDGKSRCIMSHIVNGPVTGRVTMNNRPVGQPEGLKGSENVLSMFVWLNSFDYSRLQATGIVEDKVHSWDRKGALLCSVLMEKFPAISEMIMQDPTILARLPLPKRPLKQVPGHKVYTLQGSKLACGIYNGVCIPYIALLGSKVSYPSEPQSLYYAVPVTLFGRVKDKELLDRFYDKCKLPPEGAWFMPQYLDVVILSKKGVPTERQGKWSLLHYGTDRWLQGAELFVGGRVERIKRGEEIELASTESQVILYRCTLSSDKGGRMGRERRYGIIIMLNEKDADRLAANLPKHVALGDVFNACLEEGAMSSIRADLSPDGILYPFIKK